jgi:uncharacterized protein YceK
MSLNKRLLSQCLFLVTILMLNGCGESRVLVAPGETTGVARLGKAMKDWPVWLPAPDKKSWVPAKADIPEGAWINFSPQVK